MRPRCGGRPRASPCPRDPFFAVQREARKRPTTLHSGRITQGSLERRCAPQRRLPSRPWRLPNHRVPIPIGCSASVWPATRAFSKLGYPRPLGHWVPRRAKVGEERKNAHPLDRRSSRSSWLWMWFRKAVLFVWSRWRNWRKSKPDNRGGRLRVMASLASAPHAAISRDLPGRSGVNRPAAGNLQALPSRQSRCTTECHCYEIASPLARPRRAQWSTKYCKRSESTLLAPTRMRGR